ncbi:Crotonobetainyl-CoA:carnitine CoA-transferase CaiB [Cribrihabitans marinus]|uniref:Crotonobetainyl-CoA:carnitine CoA-transferase CaiB n=1 Tax=Cribrihabitans marinus TaxID=1227549 RepID=A0A1H7CDD0_9RHOB|nr:CaiB/BaiF CoA-transferase family protein [Cribrihabitans marinus]GGH34934.1 alpha-methylacyl-CoA racemase [Cribrihabitans marinus]SEJ86587.1 Crotonobetainyl-CoA:carnitine CoA-transferase CaiB [Cribrihabitans marinus]
MLSGIRIIEFEGLGPAPFAAMMLAELGADVIVIHRATGPVAPGMPDPSPLDRSKRSIALDLKQADDRATAQALVDGADALIEGFRPGVMERLDLGPDACLARNPALVYGRMTGWGQTGPLAQTAGHDLNYVALSGALWYASPPGQPPQTPPTLLGDIGGGALYLVAGLLAGLLNARATGQGTVVDAAIYDGSAHMMSLLMSLAQSGNLSETRGHSLLDGPHWSRSYACADGGHVTVQCLEPKFYAAFLDRMGLAGDPDFRRQFDRALWPALTDRLARLFARHPRDHWAAHFAGTEACVAPVLSPSEAAAHPMNAARGAWDTTGATPQPRPAPRFSTHRSETGESPARDQHGSEIRAELRSSQPS